MKDGELDTAVHAGFLVVDKPVGPTSHDVVGWARRALGTRAIGHTGTLDPFATGVLVLAVGEATKLASYVMAGDKEYETVLRLGTETDTLDLDGAVVSEASVPSLEIADIERAASAFVGRLEQIPPAVSAIKQAGVPLYQRVRRGEIVTPAPRAVVCHAIEVLAVSGASVRLRIRCGPGFYVRALGRDLARALSTRGHLSELRRVRSGVHSVEHAVSGEALQRGRAPGPDRDAVRAAFVPLERATSPIPTVDLGDDHVSMLRVGKRPVAPAVLGVGPALAFDEAGVPVAIVERDGEVISVVRGFAWSAPARAPAPGDG